MNKNIIIAILVVIIIAIGAAFLLTQNVSTNGKMNTQINIINNETFQNGEHVHIELKDAQGAALSGKTINISFNNQKYSATTDQNGICYLTILDVDSGKYDLEASFGGDDKYNDCNAKATITVDAETAADNPAEETSTVATTSTSQNDNSNNGQNSHPGCTYNADLGVWVNADGIVVDINTNGEKMGVGMTVQQYRDFLNGDFIPPDLADDDDQVDYDNNDGDDNSTYD